MMQKAAAPAIGIPPRRERGGRNANAQAPAPAGAAAAGGGRVDPLGLLLPYQARACNDPARFVAACFARQTGKSFWAACRVARRLATVPRLTCVIAAPSERQSLESLDKVRNWLLAFSVAYQDEAQELRGVEAGFTAKALRLPNGSRCLAAPGRPDTVRGFSGDIWLDEFAFFDDPDATWRAIVPTITNSLRGGQKQVLITSTPNGKGGRGKRFYDIMTGAAKGAWSVHRVPLKAAIAEGLPVDYGELAALLDDPVAQAQELDCEFLDDANELLGYELIAAATSPEATAAAPPGLYADGGRDLRLGIDFGRMHDPTVCWCLERAGEVCYTREVLVLRNMSTPAQEEILRSRIRAAHRVCYDYTGPGIGMGDRLAQEFGLWKPEAHRFGKIELCTFSLPFKRDLFPKLRRALESPVRVRIPAGDEIREDLHAMQQIVRNGEFSYAAPHTKEGHSDRCTALALAWRAAQQAACNDLPVPVDRSLAAPPPLPREVVMRPF